MNVATTTVTTTDNNTVCAANATDNNNVTNTAITIANTTKENNFASILEGSRKLMKFTTQNLIESKKLLQQKERKLALNIPQDILEDTWKN